MEHCKSCRNLNPDLAATGLGHLGHFLDILGVKPDSWGAVKRLVSRRPWLLDPAVTLLQRWPGMLWLWPWKPVRDRQTDNTAYNYNIHHAPSSHPSLSHSRGMATPTKVANYNLILRDELIHSFLFILNFNEYENHDIAIAMSPSRADPVLPWLGVFKYLN